MQKKEGFLQTSKPWCLYVIVSCLRFAGFTWWPSLTESVSNMAEETNPIKAKSNSSLVKKLHWALSNKMFQWKLLTTRAPTIFVTATGVLVKLFAFYDIWCCFRFHVITCCSWVHNCWCWYVIKWDYIIKRDCIISNVFKQSWTLRHLCIVCIHFYLWVF